ncbi:hypothetical protein PR202_ga08015 [Eleusine coracana subsp. coracana]|uniref:Glucan endo-1,3-beta-D-glucosidase n=1 Tax=Eleusine coracana subsp. coracana TaxID=191504 RepID=A0AAV5BZ86_ELECO|nr:hypothetical protein PR202_ga08015 [Eleusine coracana subsp. coracana]
MVGNNLPSPADVVALYRSRNIFAMRIYNPDQGALSALRGSAIGLILDVGGVDVVRNLANSADAAASSWVQANVRPYYYPDVIIKYIAVGNEVNPGDAWAILPAMRNVHAALVSANLAANIKVSTAVKMDVVTDTFPPSRGVFNPNMSQQNGAHRAVPGRHGRAAAGQRVPVLRVQGQPARHQPQLRHVPAGHHRA